MAAYYKFIFLFFVLFSLKAKAQCYIQFNYDTSGNRTSRKYIGNCAKPIIKESQAESVAQNLNDSIETRTEVIRQDFEGKIKVYPNPTQSYVNILTEKLGIGWNFKLSSLSGVLLENGNLTSLEYSLDIGRLLPASYILCIYDSTNQLVFQTNIIKQ